jgi:flagellar hook-associated protein 3 FlgL
MRVSNRSTYQGIQLQLSDIAGQLKKLNEQISSGKRINRPSDDPIGITQAMGLRNMLSKIDQYQKNIELGQSWLNATESSLQGISDLIVRGKEIANQMATGTYSADQRTNAANEVQTLLDQLRALGNTQFNDRYLFSGYREQFQPYDQNFDYHGDTKDIEIPIGESVQMKINLSGDAVFGPDGDPNNNLFQIMTGLRDALQNNDISGVQSGLEKLNSFQPKIESDLADVGSRLNRMENSASMLSDVQQNNTQGLADVEDTDIVTATTDLAAKQSAYQAALYSAAQITQLSLVDFLK